MNGTPTYCPRQICSRWTTSIYSPPANPVISPPSGMTWVSLWLVPGVQPSALLMADQYTVELALSTPEITTKSLAVVMNLPCGGEPPNVAPVLLASVNLSGAAP